MNNRETARNDESGHQILAIRTTMASSASASARQTSSTARLSRLPAGTAALVAAAAALWFGFDHLLNYLLYASLFGGALTLLLLQFRQWPLPWQLAGQPWLLKLHAKETGIPYGIALAIGALMIYPETEWIRAVDLSHFALP